MIEIISQNPAQTQDLARRLGIYIREQDISCAMALTGGLGCGKTCFVQGLAKGLNVDGGYYITSPTFTIMNEYPAEKMRLYHLDLYRLSDPDELDYIGIEDQVGQNSVTVVEWPKLLMETGFVFDLHIHFELNTDFNRKITLSPSGQAGANLLSNLSL
ncbi:tRNA (adenosine(37)-N6)-threonylcarbamoyltransferase complex ATPase subunit type 1 TsaE [uncultured Desulfobacter sp.]|uniref:tRNA (adenosine(37)-N6)-threonylcarbamoyltransferase complex ATPase subunit type 1 TsaE n=1 Tax=uncultured Desulfobacter sp. TaxID=240139 RepID=UPI0029F51E6C|nr:tRNA (adenosine(37)-N6)-threonylcarbamoyltransferase complex ATPase subunit type 1 TsaE [uncultured Desulfobacter sp.]